MNAVLYKMYWSGTEYFYIGSSSNYHIRAGSHISLLKSGIHPNRMAQLLYVLYGMPSFKIIRRGPVKKMRNAEMYSIIRNGCKYCCNYMDYFGSKPERFSAKITEIINTAKIR